MSTDHRELLKKIRTFPSLIKYLHEELDWPITSGDFEELTFDYTPEELGIDSKNAAKIQEIKRLRPLSANQPWGIFFVKFEPKRLPVVALRRILSRVVVKKRASANSAERAAWQVDDLLFVSNYGEGEERRINLAHFTHDKQSNLPTLKVLGWDNLDTPLHLDHVTDVLNEKLTWPEDEGEVDIWRETWRSAFTLRHREVITTSKALAIKLAELARGIRTRINAVLAIETEYGPVTKLMKAFQEALIHDLDEDGFADMYAQTIAYGLLSARIANPGGDTTNDIATQLPVTNPFLKELMETFLDVGEQRGQAGGSDIDFDELGVTEVVELLDDANMEAVLRDFGDRSPQDDPVIHFYELFLKEYDAKKRMQRGVFYTPRPIVSYIVRSADELLRTEFGLKEGLADTTTWGEMTKRYEDLEIPDSISPDQAFVHILDPATGTGTFLVEVIDLIYKTMVEKWKSQAHGEKKIQTLWNEYVPKNLLPRLYGYELLMAPYAIAHLKIGLKLYETGYRFRSDERARVFLTNSLEPASDQQLRLDFMPALAHEAQAVSEIKRNQKFTVVVGNPPYSVKSYNNGPWIRHLLADFKKDLNEIKLNLDDDYIKFLRLLTYSAEFSGIGIYSMITNNGYLSGVTHRRIRWYLMDTFDRILVTDLHGDSRYGEISPEGWENENVFDIQQGVCIACFVKLPSSVGPQLSHADVWGSRDLKYSQLLSDDDIVHTRIDNRPPLYLFNPIQKVVVDEYDNWPLLSEWMPTSSNGIETHKDALTLQHTSDDLLEVIGTLLSTPVERTRALLNVGNDGRDWKLDSAVASLRTMVNQRQHATLITYRPFDYRFTMLNAESGGFIAYPRWDVMAHLVRIEGNVGLVSARLMARGGQWDSCLATRNPPEKKTGDSTRSSTVFPLLLGVEDPHDLWGDVRPNLSVQLIEEFHQVCNLDPPTDEIGEAYDIFYYLFALLHSPIYRKRYIENLRTNFPRLPVPCSSAIFTDLSRMGSDLVDLYLLEAQILDEFITTFSGPTKPDIGRVGWSDGTVWLDASKVSAREGHRATEPGTIGFQGVPEDVWDFHIGGYQVCHKWLKDRKGRTLTEDDLSHYQKIVVALSETIRIMQEIDEVIEDHGGWPDAFSVSDE